MSFCHFTITNMCKNLYKFQNMSVTSLRFAHTEGHCNLRYVPASKTVVTCGADGEVRVFTDGIKDDDSKSHLIGDEVYAMACTSQNKVFVAPSGTNTIRAYTLGKNYYSWWNFEKFLAP